MTNGDWYVLVTSSVALSLSFVTLLIVSRLKK